MHTLNEQGETIGKWYCIRYESGKMIERRTMPKTVEKWIKEHKFTHYECDYPVIYGVVRKVEFIK